jgi:hypothetical protein
MMNMRAIAVICSTAAFAVAISGSAQVILRGTQSPDKSNSTSQADIFTSDREIVPLTKDTKDTKTDATTERTESITRERLGDGSYFDWQHTTTVKKELAPGKTASSTDVVEQDRQGQNNVARHTDETVIKSAAGETDQTKAYTRNSSGQLVLDHVVDATTVNGSGGIANTTRVEKTADVNGNLSLKKEVDEVAVDHGPNGKVVTATTKTVDHLSGELKVAAEETTSTIMQGGTKQIESVVRAPGENGWQVSGRATTTEKTAPDGSVSRETIEQGPSVYSSKTGGDAGAMVPQRKIEEHEVRRPDGTTVVQRDVFHRDANGGWTPETFSTKLADKEVQP